MKEISEPSRIYTKRETVLVVGAIVALMLVMLWSYSRLNAAYTRANEDGGAWAQSDALARQIQALRDQPTLADDHALQKDDMTRRIANAAAAASLEEKRLIAIEHQTARRIGRSAYLEEPTRLTFKDVTLRQVLTTLDALTNDDSRMHVSRLRLTAPRQDTSTESWTVDATVTYLIYEPAEQQY
ncbi:MAG: hypothetical protein R3C45_12415 [Phycisphaerales bacterium]